MSYGLVTAWIPPLEILILIFLPFSFAGLGELRRPVLRPVAQATASRPDPPLAVAGGRIGQADRAGAVDPRQPLPDLVGQAEADQGRCAGPARRLVDRRPLAPGADPGDRRRGADLGQEVGNLAWAMRELAETGERRLAYRFQAVIQTLFPLVVVGLGLVVFFLAVAFFAPLVELIRRLAG